MDTIPLEDSYTDIIGKAMRGQSLDPAFVAKKSGLLEKEIQSLISGEFHALNAAKVCATLGLNAVALRAIAENQYHPAETAVAAVSQHNTVFEDMTVNAYLVWDQATKEALIFDTGADASGIIEELDRRGLKATHLFITHTHIDHIFDLDRLQEKTGAKAYSPATEPLEKTENFPVGTIWKIGALQIQSRPTWGHAEGGVTYVIHGLEKPVAIVGDSIFAGSMGGGKVSYEAAIKNNLEQIFSLPDETVICPGHGPLTTVGEERKHNPFFAK